jgi:hypothetical protein
MTSGRQWRLKHFVPLTQRPTYTTEWQSGQRRYLSEDSMALLKRTSDTGGNAVTDSAAVKVQDPGL